jgi:DNA-binding LytR/AlgR family response regulator
MPSALIAEDEPLLAQALADELSRAWPELTISAVVGDGRSAVEAALRVRPDVLFLDIRMPGLDGLAAAAELADVWPTERAPMPQLVFVTAYDEYAVSAFDAQALDYVLKPVQPERLRRTVARLQRVTSQEPPPEALERTLDRWRALLEAGRGGAATITAPLRHITAADSGGSTVRLVPIEDVLYFEAADKYVRVLTADREYLIRTPLRQLLPQLDPQLFWQVHRAVVVRASAIEAVHRDAGGHLHLQLRERSERLSVSRLYAHLFRAM